MKKMKLIKPMLKGFGLLEIIIALAITAILSTAGITVYNDHVVKTNQIAVQDDLLQLVTDFGKHYTQAGTYSTKEGSLPADAASVITAANTLGSSGYNEFYKIEVYSPQLQSSGKLAANTQSICIVAKPRDDTIMSNTGNVIVDGYGNVTIGSNSDAASLCGSQVPDPFPEPTNDVTPRVTPTPAPTLTPEPNNTPSGGCSTIDSLDIAIKYASGCCTNNDFQSKWVPLKKDICNGITPGTPTPSPTPTIVPTVTPTAAPTSEPPLPQACKKDFSGSVGWAKATDQCKVDSNNYGDGSCDNFEVLNGCNGDCRNTVNYIADFSVLTGIGVSCNGNCDGAVSIAPEKSKPILANGAGKEQVVCNGYANGIGVGSTIYGGVGAFSYLCNGDCKNVTLIVNPKANQGLICNGYCNNTTIYVPSSWEVKSVSQVCGGDCTGVTVVSY